MDGSLESVKTLGTKWCSLWSGDDAEPWVAMYAQKATFLDHALQINRQGFPNLQDHFKIWTNSLPDCKAVLEGSWPGERLPDGKWRVIMRTRWTGTFLNDLPTIKASGTKVNFPVRVEMVVRDDGLIEEAAEWYCSNFWDVKPVSEYHRRGDFAWTD
ncbi:hypothetical protein OIDMADRAFT_62310 [Oidiodendron maius Zn]|uniref:SnoaL-like domain-containing protein n=1 Tax=Oidiodendron maius (strain Zn) TaxID=913774 RepID=A0A0C3CSP3_OIDMZ|nr:hypothetical protein OIDMADRAFT_62310 [Oidiodendron maius Zn]